MSLLLSVPVGLAIGLLLGALGGGGSILAVPALVYLLGQSPHAATTGALVVIGLSAVTGMLAHRAAAQVRLGQGAVFGLLGVAGTVAGSRASASVDPDLLLAGFAALMLVAGAGMLRRGGGVLRRVAGRQRSTVGRAAKVLLTATGVGLLTGFFGVGGGFVVVPALVLALGFDMATAVGTSLLVIAINAGSALAVRLGSGAALDWPLLAMFTAAAMAGSLAGQKAGTRMRPRTMSLSFALLCIALAVFIAARSVPHLFAT
ncbi:MAG TPA: sulfite exporter TauE/SafE family protein [Rugosimonospora sp.]|nr:sulfite exporter TauE/SafE family protein [Rugosimonospora sp.]